MYELAVGQFPFFDDSIEKLITKIINNEVNFNKKELMNYSDDFNNIIEKLLIKEPNERSTGKILKECHSEMYTFIIVVK